MIEDLTDEQGAVALPGAPISLELPTITSPATAQIPRVCLRNTMANPGVSNIFLIFQTAPSAESIHGDNDNEGQIKIFKMIG